MTNLENDLLERAEPEPEVTIDDQIACVEREIILRGEDYPRSIYLRRIYDVGTKAEISLMSAVLATLKSVKTMSKDSEFGPHTLVQLRHVGRLLRESTATLERVVIGRPL